ncbi:uncharacterized protein LOC128323361 [Hemicordylus capensis]|uniref:uncharacterized protein LOC128323361 n=1 Tax=Hemicordylus capensis TaxID=884348 RepID=UPI002303238E|nr:uncharacterized protein LOC128323361 [Hemicordylus capensis]XP_053102311.1 uncharacterized protein LOC128323361 [Hemicordylus capensis]
MENPEPASSLARPSSTLTAAHLQSPLSWHTCGFTHTGSIQGLGSSSPAAAYVCDSARPWRPVSQLSLPATLPVITRPERTMASTQTNAVTLTHQVSQTRSVGTRSVSTQTDIPVFQRTAAETQTAIPASLSTSHSDHCGSADFVSDQEEEEVVVEPPTEVAPATYVSPNEELKMYHKHVRAMAEALGLDLRSELATIDDLVYNFMLKTQSTAPVALPMLPVITQAAKCAWEVLHTSTPTSKRLESLYRIQDKDNAYLHKHPAPNSLVIDCASTSKTGKRYTVPPDKESRKLDLLGRKVYSTSCLSIKVANYSACTAKYSHSIWENLVMDLDTLLPDEF